MDVAVYIISQTPTHFDVSFEVGEVWESLGTFVAYTLGDLGVGGHVNVLDLDRKCITKAMDCIW